MRLLMISLFCVVFIDAACAETPANSAADNAAIIVNWLQHCTANAVKTDPLAELMEMDCVFNSVKYCKIISEDTDPAACDQALTAFFDTAVAADIAMLEAYVPKSKMRRGSWPRSIALLKDKRQPPCPATAPQDACRASFAGVHWSMVQGFKRGIDRAEK
jgi:hypothetical protein